MVELGLAGSTATATKLRAESNHQLSESGICKSLACLGRDRNKDEVQPASQLVWSGAGNG